jgi:hypothetical protein
MDMAGLELSTTGALPSGHLQLQHDKYVHSMDRAGIDLSTTAAQTSGLL